MISVIINMFPHIVMQEDTEIDAHTTVVACRSRWLKKKIEQVKSSNQKVSLESR